MEQDIIEYIKKMFSSSRPAWSPELEGVLIFDTDNNVWVGSDNVGWIEFKSLEEKWNKD